MYVRTDDVPVPAWLSQPDLIQSYSTCVCARVYMHAYMNTRTYMSFTRMYCSLERMLSFIISKQMWSLCVLPPLLTLSVTHAHRRHVIDWLHYTHHHSHTHTYHNTHHNTPRLRLTPSLQSACLDALLHSHLCSLLVFVQI